MAGDVPHPSLATPVPKARELVGIVLRRLPHPRALREDLDGVSADLLDPVDRLRDPARRRRRGRRRACEIVGARHSLAPTLPRCPFAFAWRLHPRACCTSAACAPSSSTGSSPVAATASACCESRTRTRAARSPSRWSRSSARCAGSASSGTARRRSSSTSWSARRRRRGASSRKARRTRTRARSAFACPTRVRPRGTTRSRVGSRSRTPSSRTSSSSARTGARRTTSPRRSRTGSTGSRHVIRGDDHVSNTPKQINVLRALGAEPPVYAHVPSVFGADGKKLSKRHGAVSVDEFRAAGYVPEALMNFLALLGWAPDGETTIMSRDELVERFSLERVGSSPATFDYAKLDWMNGVYLRELPPDEYAERLVEYLREQGIDWPADRVRAAAPIVQEKIARLGEFPGLRGLPLPRRRAGSGAARLSHPRRGSGRARCGRPLAGIRDRDRAEAAVRGPRREAAHRLSPDPRRRDRLARVAGPVREPRAARAGRVARAHPRRSGRRRRERAAGPRRPGARPDVVDRGHAGADRRLRGRDRRPPVDPRRSRLVRPRARSARRSPTAS